MAKWAGIVAFRDEVESESNPGVWVQEVTEKRYYGDIIKNYSSLKGEPEINDDINVSNQISIISDPYAADNFHKIIYVTFMGSRWKARTVNVEFPRLTITLGGLYNEQD